MGPFRRRSWIELADVRGTSGRFRDARMAAEGGLRRCMERQTVAHDDRRDR
jgi:hypothetical protein